MEENQILDFGTGNQDPNNSGQHVKTISLNQFLLLCLFSIGLYGLWWMYKSWRFFKEKEDLDIMPFWRAFFSVFFLYGLLERIKAFAHQNNQHADYSSGALLVGYIFLNIASRLPDPLWLVSIFSFVCLIPGFNALNAAFQNDPEVHAEEQIGFNNRQVILLIIGGLFWLLMIIGLLFPEGNY